MIDKKTLAIILMGIIILVGTGVYAYNEVKEKSYQQGFQDATLIINEQIISSLTQNGFITVFVPYNNQSIPIKLIPSGGEQ